jgi:hypothetical protein
MEYERHWLSLASAAPPAPFAGMHLQWFAAEDEGRTEEPSEHKIKKAREEGRVAKSGWGRSGFFPPPYSIRAFP